MECASGLGCLYDRGSNGKGQCVGKRCGSDTSARDKDPSLIQSCDGVGSCKKGTLGYYCKK